MYTTYVIGEPGKECSDVWVFFHFIAESRDENVHRREHRDGEAEDDKCCDKNCVPQKLF